MPRSNCSSPAMSTSSSPPMRSACASISISTTSPSPPTANSTATSTAGSPPAHSARADRPARVALLWDLCQIPDYRKIAPANHAELVATLFGYLSGGGFISDDWFAGQIAFADRTDGDIDTLANRIAHIRTWTFAAN